MAGDYAVVLKAVKRTLLLLINQYAFTPVLAEGGQINMHCAGQPAPVAFRCIEQRLYKCGIRIVQPNQPRADIRHIGELGALVDVDVVLHQVRAEQALDWVRVGETVDDQQ